MVFKAVLVKSTRLDLRKLLHYLVCYVAYLTGAYVKNSFA